MGRVPVLAGTLAIIAVLVGLTIAAASRINVVGVVLTVLVVALLGFGVGGALWSRPPDE
jgi:hypothetical protein